MLGLREAPPTGSVQTCRFTITGDKLFFGIIPLARH
jgi:hypothetical protein